MTNDTDQQAHGHKGDEANNASQKIASQKNNPLHGKTLEAIVTELEAHYGWEGLYERIAINCFGSDPSIKSSLKFLRRTPWARAKVEELYIQLQQSPWNK